MSSRVTLIRVVPPLWFVLAATAIFSVPSTLSAQAPGSRRGGGGSSMSRVISPAVYASWMSNENDATGSTTTLLVLWRGSPGWHMNRPADGGGRSSSSGGSGSHGYQTFTAGGLTFTLHFDFDHDVVKMANQQVSLREVNVALVDLVDSAAGPTVVGTQWIDPVSASALAGSDPIAAIIKRRPELFAYLRCDVGLPDTALGGASNAVLWQAMNAMVCKACATRCVPDLGDTSRAGAHDVSE